MSARPLMTFVPRDVKSDVLTSRRPGLAPVVLPAPLYWRA